MTTYQDYTLIYIKFEFQERMAVFEYTNNIPELVFQSNNMLFWIKVYYHIININITKSWVHT